MSGMTTAGLGAMARASRATAASVGTERKILETPSEIIVSRFDGKDDASQCRGLDPDQTLGAVGDVIT